jgi:hypothetical protein
MRKLARLLPYLVILVLLAVAAIVLLQTGPLAERLRKSVAEEFSHQLGREVSIGKASLTVSGRVVLREVVVKNEDGSVLLNAPKVEAWVGSEGSLIPLLSKPTQVRAVRLTGPEVNLTRASGGEWSISDLLARREEAAPRFRGNITVRDAHVTVVDEKRGGQTTSIEGVDGSVRFPEAGRTTFTVSAPVNEGVCASLRLSGESNSQTGETKLKFAAEGVNAAYAVERIPGTGSFTVASGLAETKGEVAFGGEEGVRYDIGAEVSEAEVAFPWLRQPVTAAAGKLRLAQGNLRFEGVTGTVAEAPIELEGELRDLAAPTFDLDLSVTGIRYPQLRALFPKVAFPAGLLLPSPMHVKARIEGPVSDVTVSGDATVRVVKFRAIPWHDLVGKFEYHDKRLKIWHLRAHGSPRQLEAEIEVDLRDGAKAKGSVALVNVPLSMLATMAGIEGEFRGTAQANVRARFDGGRNVAGDFEVSGAWAQGMDLGKIAGEFEYRDGAVKLKGVRVRGPTAEGSAEASFSVSGAYHLEAQLSSLDLAAVGAAIRLAGLKGQCCARLEVTGQVHQGSTWGQMELGPGELQGRPFERLAANFRFAPAGAELKDVVLTAGKGRYEGELKVTGWRASPEQARLSGRVVVQGAELKDWAPAAYAAYAPEGAVDGTVELGGTLADPIVKADLSMPAVTVAGQPFEAARARARFERGRLVIEEAFLSALGGRVTVVGGYDPETGLSVRATGVGVELAEVADFVRVRYGLALTGKLDFEAVATGPASNPQVEFSARSHSLSMNELPFDEMAVAGRVKDGLLELHQAVLRRGEGELSANGKIGREPGQLDATLTIKEASLGTLLMVGDRAVWRLYRAGVRSEFFRGYGKIPRPLEGFLTTTIKATGSLEQPELDVTLGLEGLGFNGRRIERIGGTTKLWLTVPSIKEVSLRRATVDLEATHETARASLTGDVSLDGEAYLVLDVGNLDLRLLQPWVQLPAPLSGMGTINFDITGPIKRPVVRGDVVVDNLRLGDFALEAATAGPIRVQQGVLTVEEIRLRNGPMEAIGSASFPIYGLTAVPQADLHLRDASYAPIAGMTPATFDADVYLVGNKLSLQDGAGPEGTAPGIRGKMGSGTFSVIGDVLVTEPKLEGWHENRFDIRADFRRAQVSVPGALDLKLDGSVVLTDDEQGEAVLRTEEGAPLVVSDGQVGIPEKPLTAPSPPPLLAPRVEVRVLVGENVWFRQGSPRRPTQMRITPGRESEEGEPSGYLDLRGRLTADDLLLHGEFESSEGQLVFPNGVLMLRRGTAWVERERGKQPVVTVSAEADGRVGDYLVSLKPSGQIYPYGTAPLSLNLDAIPYLEPAYVMALLVGPVIAPTRGERPDITTLLATPGTYGTSGGEITGIRLPTFGGALGMQEFSLDVALAGQVRLRLGQRILERLVVSYVSTLSGPAESRTLRLNCEVTPLWSVGWSVNELDQGRWEVQAFVPF